MDGLSEGLTNSMDLLLQLYDFIVEHRKGSKNGNADELSREPWCQEAANSLVLKMGKGM